ncbi:MAG: hypothetical protein VXZ39_01695, partial [Planctomycetota bacterium]|nr:hypothetical protein [Planctomycetota bacterium]
MRLLKIPSSCRDVRRALHAGRRFSNSEIPAWDLAAALPAPQQRHEVILVHTSDVESFSLALRFISRQNF